MKTLVKIAVLTGAWLSLSGASTAQEAAAEPKPTISVASMEIPFAYHKDGNGVYNQVLERLTKGYSGGLDITFYPSARYNKVMIERAADCDYIAIDKLDRWAEHGVMPDELEFIGPINTLSVVVYVPKDAPDVSTVAQLRELSVASDVNLLPTVHGHGVKEVFALQDQRQMLKLVAIRRIEGLIGYDFDLDFLSRHMKLRNRVKKASLRLDSLVDGIVCFRNDRTEAFRNHLRTELEDIQASGWLDAVFADYR